MRAAFFLLLCLAPPPARTINGAPSSTTTSEVPASSTNAQPEGVKCYYFRNPPMRTYCLLPGLTGNVTPSDVENECYNYRMGMPSTRTTHLSRSCTLMKIFSLEDQNLFLGDRAIEVQLLTWGQCTQEALREDPTRVPWNYRSSDVAVVCDGRHYRSRVSSCVAIEEDSNEVVYCHFTEEFSAAESSLRCDHRGFDVTNVSLLSKSREVGYWTFFELINQEVWVDWRKEDIGEMNGVTALNSNESDWNSPCVTVSLVGFKPWFFKRSCSKLYPIICQDHRGSPSYSTLESRNFSMAAAFCHSRNETLLLCSALDHRTPLQLLHYMFEYGLLLAEYEWLIWDGSFKQQHAGDNCTAMDWFSYFPQAKSHNCSGLLGYTCAQTNPLNFLLPPESKDLYCENVNRTGPSRRLTCVERMYRNFEEAVKACAEHGMSTLPEGLRLSEYQKLLKDYETDSHADEVKTYWLKPNRYSEECFALLGYNDKYIRSGMNCSARHRTVCVLNQEKCEWRSQCLMNGNCSLCVSEKVRDAWNNLTSSQSIQRIVDGLKVLDEEVSAASDIQTMPTQLERILRNIDTLVVNLSIAKKADTTQQLANTAVDLAGKIMHKTEIWAQMGEEQRLTTAADLVKTVEDFVIKMVGFQDSSFVNSSVGSGNLTVQVIRVTGDTLKQEIGFGSDSGSKVHFPPDFVARDSEGVSIIFSENLLVKGILNCTTCSSAKVSSTNPVVVTPFVTVSLVVNGTRITKIKNRVQLSLRYENPWNMVEPKCSFIKPNDLNVSVWSEEGCEAANITNDTVVCYCDHLTTFAVLMSPTAWHAWPHAPEYKGLEWITKIGCGISIVCLLVCVVIFTAYRRLRSISNTIHRNLCLSLLIAEVLLLIGMKRNNASNKVPCTIMAFFLHFFFLSAFGWMALEGCHIIVLLWKVFNQKRSYYERYYLAGYGIPLLIAIITLGSQYDSYSKTQETYCWLPSEKGIRYSFIGPVAAVILLNLGALFLVLWKMSQMRLLLEKSTAEKVQNWLRGTFILLPILGITWLLGFLMLGSSEMHLAGAYLFTIVNSLQGLGILVCHVLLNKKTRQVIFRTVASVTSTVGYSRSSQSSRSNSTSLMTTRHTTSSSSNSTSVWYSRQEGEQPLQTFDTEGNFMWTGPRKWWHGAFRYNLKIHETSATSAPRDVLDDRPRLVQQ